MLYMLRLALRITTEAYDEELLELVRAAIADLGIVGADFEWEDDGTDVTIDDALIRRAVITYCRFHFGTPDDGERMKASYDEQKAQIRCNPRYTGRC